MRFQVFSHYYEIFGIFNKRFGGNGVFWERFYELCLKKGTKPNPLAKELGISSGIITKWKSGSVPNGEMLVKIADHLECSIDYLMGRTDNPEINK